MEELSGIAKRPAKAWGSQSAVRRGYWSSHPRWCLCVGIWGARVCLGRANGVVGWVTSLGPVCECVGLVWPRVTMISPLPQDLSSLLVECARNKILSRAGNIKLLNRLTKTCS